MPKKIGLKNGKNNLVKFIIYLINQKFINLYQNTWAKKRLLMNLFFMKKTFPAKYDNLKTIRSFLSNFLKDQKIESDIQ